MTKKNPCNYFFFLPLSQTKGSIIYIFSEITHFRYVSLRFVQRVSPGLGWNGRVGRHSHLSSSSSTTEEDGIFVNSASSKLLERAHDILMSVTRNSHSHYNALNSLLNCFFSRIEMLLNVFVLSLWLLNAKLLSASFYTTDIGYFGHQCGLVAWRHP